MPTTPLFAREDARRREGCRLELPPEPSDNSGSLLCVPLHDNIRPCKGFMRLVMYEISMADMEISWFSNNRKIPIYDHHLLVLRDDTCPFCHTIDNVITKLYLETASSLSGTGQSYALTPGFRSTRSASAAVAADSEYQVKA